MTFQLQTVVFAVMAFSCRNQKEQKLKLSAYNFIISLVYFGFILQLSQGYEVIQPKTRTINPGGWVSISCEHNANVTSTLDIRLDGISPKGETKMLCQKDQADCKDIIMYQENPTKWVFILFKLRPEALNLTYGCEFTVEMQGVHRTRKGTPTTLIQAQKEAEREPPSPQPHQDRCKPPPPQSHQDSWTLLEFILIGLLAVTLLYSCVLTFCFIRKRVDDDTNEPENPTYVEMRKAPSGHPELDMPYELLALPVAPHI